MHLLKYQYLFDERGEEGGAPGKFWQDKATPWRRLSPSPQAHDAISPASPALQPRPLAEQPTPQPEYEMALMGFSEQPSPAPNDPPRLAAERGASATAESDAVGEKGGMATALAQEDGATSDTQPTPKHHGSQVRKVHQVSGYITDPEFAEVERMRGSGANQLTRGAVVTKLIRVGLRATLDNEQAELLEPRIEQTMNRLFAAFGNRFMRVISQTYYAAKAGDSKITDLMSLAYGDNTAEFHKKIADAEKEARLSLTRRKAWENPTPEEEGSEPQVEA